MAKFLFLLLMGFTGNLMCLQLTSPAFKNDGTIPSDYTCDGKNISPPLTWKDIPQGTKSFVLIVDDPDAPHKTWTHWIVYNITAETTAIREGAVPQESLQGINDFGQAAYGGPCPPQGVHRYFFKLYAIDKNLQLPQGANKVQIEKEIEGHVLAVAELMGSYSRKK